ncbi:MAG: AMP-binding protein, partial [Bacteroidota bacterium]
MLNLSTFLENSTRQFPQKDAIIYADKKFSYDQINKGANQVANGLRAIGITQGDKVALSCLNIPYFPIVYYGILKAGAVVVPLSVLLKRAEVAFHLQDSEAKAFICFEGTPQLPMRQEGIAGFQKTDGCKSMIIIPADLNKGFSMEGVSTFMELTKGQPTEFQTAGTSADDTAVIVYTSGTTGQPKGAQLSHSNLLLNAIISADLFKSTAVDKQLIVLPLFHIFGMTTLLNAGFYKGATSVLLPRFDGAVVLDLMEQHEITLFAGVPTMYWGLLNALATSSADLTKITKNLRIAISGGASLPQAILEEFD